MKNALKMLAVTTMMGLPVVALANEDHMQAKADYYFTQMDTNKDSMVSKAEHTAFADKMFMDADTNKNGSLSKEELLAAKKAEHEKMESSMGK